MTMLARDFACIQFPCCKLNSFVEDMSVIDDDQQGEEYAFIRKLFMIPKKWKSNALFVAFANYRYTLADAPAAVVTLRTMLTAMGYADENSFMLHDYIHYLLMDMLDEEGGIFLTEADIRNSSSLLEEFNHTTPDLVIRTASTPIIMDIYTGVSKEITRKKEHKYDIGDGYVVLIASVDSMASILSKNKLLPAKQIEHLMRNIALFRLEHRYWMLSLRSQQLIQNDVGGSKMIVGRLLANNAMEKLQFGQWLEQRAASTISKNKKEAQE